MQDYSQNGEQSVILDYFGEFRGAYLDLGANDGITLSNTRALHERFWNGVLVEPSPIAFEALRRLHGLEVSSCNHMLHSINAPRWATILVNAAICDRDGEIELWDSGEHLGRGDTSLLSTTVPAEMGRWKKSGEKFTPTKVRGITMESLIRHVCSLDLDVRQEPLKLKFDFISIDCEGQDWNILTQIDLSAIGCKMLCVETNGKENAKFIEYAAKHGMGLHWKCAENLIFTKNS